MLTFQTSILILISRKPHTINTSINNALRFSKTTFLVFTSIIAIRTLTLSPTRSPILLLRTPSILKAKWRITSMWISFWTTFRLSLIPSIIVRKFVPTSSLSTITIYTNKTLFTTLTSNTSCIITVTLSVIRPWISKTNTIILIFTIKFQKLSSYLYNVGSISLNYRHRLSLQLLPLVGHHVSSIR